MQKKIWTQNSTFGANWKSFSREIDVYKRGFVHGSSMPRGLKMCAVFRLELKMDKDDMNDLNEIMQDYTGNKQDMIRLCIHWIRLMKVDYKKNPWDIIESLRTQSLVFTH